MSTLFITSGCRPELFCETIDSFVTACDDTDLISNWLCIDDGTCDSLHKPFEEKYPFINFVWKSKADVGHAKSLNMSLDMITTKYVIRLEDDWKFTGRERNFIRDAIEILEERDTIGQVMFNRNYEQRVDDNLLGGLSDRTRSGLEFLHHEYLPNQADHEAWRQKHGYGRSVLLTWPHFSLQPSVTRREALGRFNEENSYFEYEFALGYAAKGWTTAFLTGVACEHIGRLCNDFAGPLNAYEILGQKHFGRSPRKVDTIVYKY